MSWQTSQFARSSKTSVFFNQRCNYKILHGFEYPKAERHSLFYNSLHYLLPFGLGGALIAAEEVEDSDNQSITMVSVEQPLASPGSAIYIYILLVLLRKPPHEEEKKDGIKPRAPISDVKCSKLIRFISGKHT